MSSYNVSKAAVVALSETLRFELAPWNIATTVVCPSFVKTNLASSFRSPDPVLAEISAKLISQGRISADELAQQVFDAVARRQFLVITDRASRVAWFGKRFAGPEYRRRATAAAHRLRRRIESADGTAADGPDQQRR
jgi:NAD(P)-dependent dehydrogenase (short-subunit alcohol dehydrogenase family)